MQAKAAPTAHPHLGEVALLLERSEARLAAGDAQAAGDACRAVLALLPSHPLANHRLGLINLQLGRPDGLVCLATALKAAPEEQQFWISYISALLDTGEVAGARQVLEMGRQHGLAGAAVDGLAARLQPASAAESTALIALYAQGSMDQAFGQAQALALRYPADPLGLKIQAAVHRMRGTPEAAVAAMERVLRIDAGDAEAHANLGILLNELGRHTEAETALESARSLAPDDADVWNNLGIALQHKSVDAEAAFRRALALAPDHVNALNNLAQRLQEQGRTSEALPLFRRALALQPDFHAAHSNLLFCLSQIEGVDSATVFAAHCAFGRALDQAAHAGRHIHPHANTRDAQRPVRIGLVSGDLRNHALMSFLEPVLACLARRPALELTAYYNHPVHDGVTARVRGLIRGWRDIYRQSDSAVAAQIRADGIDILIDLSGHTAFNRLPLFAMKPAPVQVSWLGYPATTGLDAVDYYLADHFQLPPGRFDAQFTEKLVQLPMSAPFQIAADAPPVTPLPARANGFVTFGSFNRPSKISRAVVAAWARLLRALPGSRLLIGAMPEDGNREPLAGWLAAEGIAGDRLEFHARAGLHAYLALHQRVDICLDTFPYSGGTTTLHALSMGVPTLTLAGATAAGRQSACILEHSSLPHYVAANVDDFVDKGLAACARLDELAALRAILRQHFPPAPLAMFDAVADGIESALRTMWQRWCAGETPASFAAPPDSAGASLDELAQAAAQSLIAATPAAPPPPPIYVTRPSMPPLADFLPMLEQIWENRLLSNGGPFHQRFEQALAAHLGVEYVSLFANGTIALMTALQALEVEGEVITTPYSFVATSHALLWNRLTPVFVDIDPVSFNLDPARIEASITPRTSAILPVHCYGTPCDVEAISAVAARHGLRVIYDAAHAFGVRCDDSGASILNHGDLAVLSFHATKVFNTFEGGAIVCRDASMKQRIDELKNFGIVDELTVTTAGLNGKMSEFNAAFGLLQLDHVGHAVAGRARVDSHYRRALAGVPGILCMPDRGAAANFGYFPILVGDAYPLSRDDLYDKLRAAGIWARRYFSPLISEFPMYRALPSAAPAGLQVATRIASQVLCLPIFPELDDVQIERIAGLIGKL
jgi:predicted O-linked N-acetylglucosamine transferase (SPINDLY family)/dTDP-4-amino-4,6-dideoxygalactose transaminase